MCFPKPKKLPDPTPPPEKPTEPPEIAGARQAEDDALFGGVPDLRSPDRSATAGGVATGTGLNTM